MKTFSLCVPAGEPVQRIDKFLSQSVTVREQCGDANRSRLKNIIVNMLINGDTAKFSSKVKPGDTVLVDWEEQVPENIIPEDIPLDIIYDDDNVTVVNKKQGMVTHPAAGHWSGTLVNALLFHWNREYVSADRRPGIVHRLDKDTSGLIITAKDYPTEEWLCSRFRLRDVKKEYIAIVTGRPPRPSGVIKTRLTRDPRNRKRFIASPISSGKGKFACTVYKCIASYGSFSLMRLKLKTGRTHQIRVHMKYIGCPILGDPVYGNKSTVFPDATLMLHSRRLVIRVSATALPMEFVAPVPRRFKKVLKVLHHKYSKAVVT